jgi:hypothetical protein
MVARLAAAFALALLASCAGSAPSPSPVPGTLQCVPYARAHSAVKITGDASTWWEKAKGRYARRLAPSPGAVMVLFNYAGPNRAHVAVVRKVVDRREIRVDHANWYNDGKIYVDDPVRDVSPDQDWSQVNVFNLRVGQWGLRTYSVQGFIGPDGGGADEPIASLIWNPAMAARLDAIANVASVRLPPGRPETATDR